MSTTCWETMRLLYKRILYTYKILLVGVYAANLHQDAAKFSLNALIDATLPVLHPIVAAGSDRCEYLKSILGITYTQMQGKNASNSYDALNVDLITKNGSLKYNMSAAKLGKAVANANNIIVLLHGFMESSEGLMVQAIAPEYLKKPGVKILALDGRKVINLEYFSSSTHARFMGEKLGDLLGEMIKNGEDPSKMVMIGHSLGAHIAGIAGKRVKQLTGKSVGRITGLDPAGPCFSNIDSAGKLSRTDAAYVDVVHTNAGMLGLNYPVGHKDFYPNGGLTQPGCFLATCDHSRAWELLAESINTPERFPARKCENRTLFKNGVCSKNEVAYMGDSRGSPGLYFFTTTSSSPFGLGLNGTGLK